MPKRAARRSNSGVRARVRVQVVAVVVAAAAAIVWTQVAATMFRRVGAWSLQDLHLYFDAAEHVVRGGVPYVDFPFEYPPFALFPIMLPDVLARAFGGAAPVPFERFA